MDFCFEGVIYQYFIYTVALVWCCSWPKRCSSPQQFMNQILLHGYDSNTSPGHLQLIVFWGCGDLMYSIVLSFYWKQALRPQEKTGSQPETLIILSSFFHELHSSIVLYTERAPVLVDLGPTEWSPSQSEPEDLAPENNWIMFSTEYAKIGTPWRSFKHLFAGFYSEIHWLESRDLQKFIVLFRFMVSRQFIHY